MHGRSLKQAHVHHPPCDLCGGESFEPLARRDRRGDPLRTVVCRDCGLVRHWRVPSDDELAEFYGLRYRQSYHGEETPSPRRVMRAWQKAERIHETVAPHLPPGARLLEIGAGIGCTVKYFERQGFRAEGIEPHGGFQRYSAERLQVSIQQGDVFTYQPEQLYDAVLLVHVIEHLRSPRQALRQIRQMLRPGGQLYVECPDLSAHFRLREGMFHYAHIHNFTRPTLSALAESCGFSVQAWLSPGREPNLCLLLRATGEPSRPVLDPRGYGQALASFERYNWLTYHARWMYLNHRLRKLAGYAWERVYAGRFVSRLQRDLRRAAAVSEAAVPAAPCDSIYANHERAKSAHQSSREAA